MNENSGSKEGVGDAALDSKYRQLSLRWRVHGAKVMFGENGRLQFPFQKEQNWDRFLFHNLGTYTN